MLLGHRNKKKEIEKDVNTTESSNYVQQFSEYTEYTEQMSIATEYNK